MECFTKAAQGRQGSVDSQFQGTFHYGEEVLGGRSLQQLVASHPQPGASDGGLLACSPLFPLYAIQDLSLGNGATHSGNTFLLQ